jgi:transcriptional regulator with XRE-family HTH domain
MIKQNFGTSLNVDRTLLGFTQTEFCSALSEFSGTVISQQTLARWEKGAVPRYESCVNLFNFLKHLFEGRGIESEVVKLGLPEPSNSQKIQEFFEANPTATGKEAAQAIGVTHNHFRKVKSTSGLTNRKTAEELLQIVDDQASEIAKLKDVIRTLIS